jgi:ABC-type multidrug transport system fused ATPase/permease subunit
MGLLIASGVLAFLAWCIIDTDLKPEDVCNSRGEITVRRILAVVFVQIVLWALVCLFSVPIMRHLPRFMVTGWRLPLTFVVAEFWQWFALLMILQYVWMLVGTTVKTAVVFVMAKLGSHSARQSLDDATWHFIETEKLASIKRKQIGRTSEGEREDLPSSVEDVKRRAAAQGNRTGNSG